jgi:nucleoside-diphosphate-sugar epimerase
MSKVCLVAGGAGFIGRHLCAKLLQNGYQVVCVDSLITGHKKNIEPFLKNENFKYVNLDIADPTSLKLRGVCADFIFHLASPASPVDYQNHSEETLLANSLGTRNLLQLALKNKARVVIASTSEIYGDPKEHPQKESYLGNVNSFGPRSCYDESKRFAEALTYVYLHKYDLDIRIARIFNTYGPYMQKDDGRVISNFINQALEGKDLTVYGQGKQTRSFCYVSDLVEGLYKLMFTPGLKGEVINLGNPEEYTIVDLAKKIIAMTGTKSKIIFKPLPQDDPMQRCPDITRAKKLLNWQPKVASSEGLQKTINYYRNDL